MGESQTVTRELIESLISEFTWSQRVSGETTDAEIDLLLDEWDEIFQHYHGKPLGAENRRWLREEALEWRRNLDAITA